MTVSPEMAKAALYYKSQMKKEGYFGKSPEQGAQEVVNAAWTRFDPEDKSTWPKTKMAPSGQRWAIKVKVMDELLISSWSDRLRGFIEVANPFVTHYADPATLSPK